MKLYTNKILETILLPINSDWQIDGVIVNESACEVEVKLSYKLPKISVANTLYPIYDHRVERHWRHLDLWQYKTFLVAQVPRYKDTSGNVRTIDIPWADANERITVLLEKKL